MAAGLAWHLNLDADRELQDAARYRPTVLGEARVRELIGRMADLVGPEDVWLGSGSQVAGRRVVAFCPTPSALRYIQALGLPVPAAPAYAILRAVNDRGFCAGLGHGLEGACFARDMAQLCAQLASPTASGWYVIKRAFSFAGREQRRVPVGVVDEQTRRFVSRSFARGEGVQVEPWVERLADFSCHGYLTRTGRLLEGIARQQHCDAYGRFLRMSTQAPLLTPPEHSALVDTLRETANALTAAGYFGPFGVDGFRYKRTGQDTAFNPRCEINARLTMGYPKRLLLAGLAQDVDDAPPR